MYFPDLGQRTQIAAGPRIRAIGWLDIAHKFSRGDVPEPFVAKLRRFASAWFECVVTLNWPTAGGAHECQFCGEAEAAGNFGVPAGDVLYVCPELVAHYVTAHGYRPPDEFIQAVLKAPLPGTDEYVASMSRFSERASGPEET